MPSRLAHAAAECPKCCCTPVPPVFCVVPLCRVWNIIQLFTTPQATVQKWTKRPKAKRPRTEAITREIHSPVSMLFIRAATGVLHVVHDWLLRPVLGSGYHNN